jgi:hypothetical protein
MFGARGVCKDGHVLGLDCFFCGADHISVLAVGKWLRPQPSKFLQSNLCLFDNFATMGVRSDVCE